MGKRNQLNAGSDNCVHVRLPSPPPIQFPIVNHMEQLRRVLLYELFIAHYLQMARAAATATPHRAYNQALIYLKQAARLCQLLADDDRVEQAASYASCVTTLQQVVLNEQHRESDAKPQLPQRETFARAAATPAPEAARSGGGGGAETAGPTTAVTRLRVAPPHSGAAAYANLEAMNGAIDALAAKVNNGAKRPPAARQPAMPGILRVHGEVHAGPPRADADEVRRPQTPIGAHSFFDEPVEPAVVEAAKPVLVLGLGGQFELRNGGGLRAQPSVVDEDVTAL